MSSNAKYGGFLIPVELIPSFKTHTIMNRLISKRDIDNNIEEIYSQILAMVLYEDYDVGR